MHFSNSVILIFAKAPVAGKVKTRLGLPDKLSATVFSNLLAQMVDAATCDDIANVELYVAVDTQHLFIKKLATTYSLQVKPQSGNDLGQRMSNAIDEALKQYQSVVLVGSDCMDITGQDYYDAFTHLQTPNTVVVQPAVDGGYVMVASNTKCKALFNNVSWGTDRVLKQTLDNAKKMSAQLIQLRQLRDIDYLNDLKTLYLGE